MAAPSDRVSRAVKPAALPPPCPQYCVVGDMLCEVRTWTEAEWAALPPEFRPVVFEHAPGLGWVGAVPAGRRK